MINRVKKGGLEKDERAQTRRKGRTKERRKKRRKERRKKGKGIS